MLCNVAWIILFLKMNCIFGEKQNLTDNLNLGNISKLCKNKDLYCKSNNTNVCALTIYKNRRIYKDFDNACYLFISNMCNPSNEYHIATSGSCESYLTDRRSDMETTLTEAETTTNMDNYDDSTTDITPYADIDYDNMTGKLIMRTNQTHDKFGPIYDVEYSYDHHKCPHSCPDTYSPVCVNVNRGFGKYFKMLMFINHCKSDIYYCRHYEEFAPPPDEDENVRSSPLGWSFCGASRYLQFARFSEVLSALGHYGWLAGDYTFPHIMEPHERIPGYGKK